MVLLVWTGQPALFASLSQAGKSGKLGLGAELSPLKLDVAKSRRRVKFNNSFPGQFLGCNSYELLVWTCARQVFIACPARSIGFVYIGSRPLLRAMIKLISQMLGQTREAFAIHRGGALEVFGICERTRSSRLMPETKGNGRFQPAWLPHDSSAPCAQAV